MFLSLFFIYSHLYICSFCTDFWDIGVLSNVNQNVFFFYFQLNEDIRNIVAVYQSQFWLIKIVMIENIH